MRYFFILTVVFSFSVLAEKDLKEIDLVKLHVSPNQDAKIFSFHGTPDVFTLKKVEIKKPKDRILKKLKFVTDDDKYAIKIFDKSGKNLITIGIGNPFYASYEHIGYEERTYMGGPVSSNNIDIAIPLEIEPSYLVISRRDVTGKFIDLQEILLPEWWSNVVESNPFKEYINHPMRY